MNRPLYPGEFTRWLNDERPAKKIRFLEGKEMSRMKMSTYRERVRSDNVATNVKAEMEMRALT